MSTEISYGTADTDLDLQQILALQAENLSTNISGEVAKKEGFVTVQHDFGLLKRMNTPYPHTVATANGKVVGYTLVMLRSFAAEIPVLLPMFDRINEAVFDGVKLGDSRYFIMGQVCIAKEYRGQGVFAGLYQKMAEAMAPDFDFIITEIATRNLRSIRAHRKVGFRPVMVYDDGEEWEVDVLCLP